jgi:hypothetical protein
LVPYLTPLFDDMMSFRSINRRWSSQHIDRPLYLPTGASVAVAACSRTVVNPLPDTFLTGGWFQAWLVPGVSPLLFTALPSWRTTSTWLRLILMSFHIDRPFYLRPTGASVAVAGACNSSTVVDPVPGTFPTGGWFEESFSVIYRPSKLADNLDAITMDASIVDGVVQAVQATNRAAD